MWLINNLAEIEYLFENLFADKKLPLEVKNQYLDFSNTLLSDDSSDNLKVNIQKIIEYKLDVEAIEYYLRIKFQNNILSKKIHALLYLVEVRGEFFDDFHVKKNSFVTGFFALASYTLRSLYKFFKGMMLVKYYGIIWRHYCWIRPFGRFST